MTATEPRDTGHRDVAIRQATPPETGWIARFLATVFDDLPLHHWLFPDAAGPSARIELFSGYFEMLVEHAMAHGYVEIAGDNLGAAVWFREPGPALEHYEERLRDITGPHLARFQALDTAMHAVHPTGRAHDHGAFTVIRQDCQSQGIGGALLRHHLATADARGVPCYIEASNEGVIRFLQRRGFLLTGKDITPEGGPAFMHGMWREPASS